MDASIAFELSRPENTGNAFQSTINTLRFLQSARTSMADILALAVVHSARSCSGGKVVIPFRGGRVDATEAGPAGVPQPQENLQHHTSLFSKLGFNVSEMAGLVTCDHTLGGASMALLSGHRPGYP